MDCNQFFLCKRLGFRKNLQNVWIYHPNGLNLDALFATLTCAKKSL
ncbi:hypothetical protein WQG_6360 [Bibersteinia trehalosi USDA-ARS-USMARC-192]|nr:hypothetical protein WQG_6360 [Bibersteinia trehalosi USDA-ARS-USMARC-192]